MSYVDLDTIHNPTPGGIATAAYGDQIRANQEALIDPSSAKAVRTATQAITTGASFTAIQFTATDEWDNDSIHDPSSNSDRMTTAEDGIYLALGHARFAANSTGYREARIDVTSVGQAWHMEPSPHASVETSLTPRAPLALSAGDIVRLSVRQTSGGNLNITYAWLALIKLARL